MRVRLLSKSKPNNYTESCIVNVADGWRERNVWYPGRSVRYASKEVTTAKSSAERTEVSRGHSSPSGGQRTESTGVSSITEKGEMSTWVQKTRKAAYREIARNAKGM